MHVISRILFGASKKNLLLTASLVWGYAAYRVLETGFTDVIYHASSYWLNVSIGLIGAYFFFIYVFYKIYIRHTKRIISLKPKGHCILSFFDLKSYLIMTIMITGGIAIRKTHIISPLYVGTFYITLGGALLSASLSFIYSFIAYKE